MLYRFDLVKYSKVALLLKNWTNETKKEIKRVKSYQLLGQVSSSLAKPRALTVMFADEDLFAVLLSKVKLNLLSNSAAGRTFIDLQGVMVSFA